VKHFDKELEIEARESFWFIEKKGYSDFLNAQGDLYRLIYDTGYLKSKNFINDYMTCYQQALLDTTSIEISYNDRNPTKHITFENGRGRYISHWKCIQESCKLDTIRYATIDGSPINLPSTETDKKVIQAIEKGDHKSLYELSSEQIYFGDYISIENPYFQKKYDGAEFLNGQGNFFEIIFDQKNPDSFRFGLQYPYEIQISEYKPYNQREIRIINSKNNRYSVFFKCPKMDRDKCYIDKFEIEIH